MNRSALVQCFIKLLGKHRDKKYLFWLSRLKSGVYLGVTGI